MTEPVTLGSLRVWTEGPDQLGRPARKQRPATVADLVSALRTEGELILDDLGDCYRYTTPYRFHATGLTMKETFGTEAQPFPPAGE